MDSGNSGSVQSSSGGDEEYDSRAAANGMFIPSYVGPISNQFPPSIFDPFSNFTHLPQNPNSSILNPNNIAGAWPRSDPMMLPSSSFAKPALGMTENSNPGVSAAAAAGTQNQNQTAARNPKKRSRASRRAPTTVLTTDTTNFRAMVQEFTGIPAPPFTASSFPRTRLDLFGGTRSDQAGQPPPPPYLRRPFTQKVQSPAPFLSTYSNSPTTTTASTSTTPLMNNYQPPIPQNSTIFNPQNPLLTSLLQSNPKFLLSPPSFGFQSGGLDEFGLHDGNHGGGSGNGTLIGLPNLISRDQIGTHTANAENWRNSETRQDESEGFQAHENYSYQKNPISGGGGEPENIPLPPRGEGAVDSWIFSSD